MLRLRQHLYIVLNVIVALSTLNDSRIGLAQDEPSAFFPENVQIEVGNILKSPVDSVFAIITPDGEAWLRDSDRQLLSQLATHSYVRCDSIAWSPDGNLVAAGTAQDETILWSAATGEIYRILEGLAVQGFGPGDCGNGGSLMFSPDGNILAAPTYRGGLALWYVSTGNRLHTLSQNGYFCHQEFSSDGSLIAVTGCWFPFVMWEVQTGREIRFIGDATTFSFSPDGSMIAVGMFFNDKPLNRVVIVDTYTFEELYRYETPFLAIALEWTLDNSSVLIQLDYPLVSQEGFIDGSSVLRWDIENNRIVRRYEFSCDLVIPYQPGANEVLLSFDSFVSPKWGLFLNTETGELAGVNFQSMSLTTLSVTCDRIFYFQLSPDNSHIFTLTEGNRIIVWDRATGNQGSFLLPDTDIRNVQWLDDRQRLLITLRDGRVLIWDI